MLTRRAFTALSVFAAAAAAVPFTATLAAAADPLPDKVMGDPDAPVEIVEYASMTCPHCASFHATTFKQIKEEYIDTGKAKFILREFPFDPLAAAVFMLARCADDKYYDVVDLYFETQRQWAVRQGALPVIRSLAKQAGFTDQSFEACLTDQKLLDGINAVKDAGYAKGVRATPTIFIDGVKLEGSRNIRAFREIIEPKLEG
ncbi:MAG: DsbA family protein [Pseudomonadota bacterium]